MGLLKYAQHHRTQTRTPRAHPVPVQVIHQRLAVAVREGYLAAFDWAAEFTQPRGLTRRRRIGHSLAGGWGTGRWGAVEWARGRGRFTWLGLGLGLGGGVLGFGGWVAWFFGCCPRFGIAYGWYSGVEGG